MIKRIRQILREEKITSKDDEAVAIVTHCIRERLGKSDPEPEFTVYILCKCYELQNWKYLLSSTLPDGMYYAMTYNGYKHEWCLDAYKKFSDRAVTV